MLGYYYQTTEKNMSYEHKINDVSCNTTHDKQNWTREECPEYMDFSYGFLDRHTT